MPRPHDALLKETAKWLEYAQADLDAAEQIFASPACAEWIAANHARQCAEKALKGLLTAKEAAFPFTHAISLLRELCEPHASWIAEIADADRLTEFATTARYPGVGKEVTRQDASRAIALARQVLILVQNALRDEGVIEQ